VRYQRGKRIRLQESVFSKIKRGSPTSLNWRQARRRKRGLFIKEKTVKSRDQRADRKLTGPTPRHLQWI